MLQYTIGHTGFFFFLYYIRNCQTLPPRTTNAFAFVESGNFLASQDHDSHLVLPVFDVSPDMGVLPHSHISPILGGMGESGKQLRVSPLEAYEAQVELHCKILCLYYVLLTLFLSLLSSASLSLFSVLLFPSKQSSHRTPWTRNGRLDNPF